MKRPASQVVQEVAAHELHATPGAPPRAAGESSVWAVYDGYPSPRTPFVVREWRCVKGAPPAPQPIQLAATLARARALVPPGCRRRPRQKADDRRILETWVPRAEPVN